MDILKSIFDFQDLSGTFSVLDVALSLSLSFILSAVIAWIYQKTHKGTSYTQSFVQTLVLMGMVVAIIMMIVGSNIARAFSLVGALSIIRFRNAVKETRDVGFIFFVMAVGMAMGTKFYLLGIIATVVIGLFIFLMYRFDWFARKTTNQVLRVQVKDGTPVDKLFDDVFLKYAVNSNLISIESVRSSSLTELIYGIELKSKVKKEEFVGAMQKINGNLNVELMTGYNAVDL